jgi:hypothetical protein
MVQTKLTIIGWQRYMSFLGNLAAAGSAKAIGKYNASVAYEEAQYERKKAAVREEIYKTVEKPRLLDLQDQQYSKFFVDALNTGAEFREGTTPFLVGLKNKQLQSFDLAMADYNSKVAVTDQINQSLLIEARGRGEEFKGKMTANTQYMAALGSLLTMGSQSQQAGRLVIT